jgi:DNA-binding CsgD family transcriptional regulator
MMPAENRIDRLTDRQKDCLALVAQGYTSKEIGRQLSLSPSTVDNHVLAAMQVLDAPSRAVAARKFAAHDDRQKIPSQSPALANAANSTILQPVAEASSWARLGRLAFELPPIGGQRNDLGWTERTFRILQVAVLSLGVFLSLALLIAGAFSIFS